MYGDPNSDGLNLLLTAMHNITDQKIVQECATLLKEFATDMCAVPSNDSLHSYPYGCRVYAPGDQIYASSWFCNQQQWNTNEKPNPIIPEDPPEGGGTDDTKKYTCPEYKKYVSCNEGYYLAIKASSGNWVHDPTPAVGNSCVECPKNSLCPGGTSAPITIPTVTDPDTDEVDCGTDYVGSLYQKMVKYASQVCIRPSDLEEITKGYKTMPTSVLENVNIVMDSIKVEMSNSLSSECERLGGVWVDTQWVDIKENNTDNEGSDNLHDITGHTLYKYFYDETGANTKWGYCAEKNNDTNSGS